MPNLPLRLLQWATHVTACGLLLMAVVTVLRDGLVAVAAAGVLLGLVYAAGPVLERRPIPALVWLGLVTGGWAALAVAAPPFVWPVFGLLFAYLRMLPLWAAMFGMTVLTSAAIAAAVWHAGELTVPLVLGPAIAAVLVTLLGLACEALHAEAART
ncbi:hypothetical protein FE391_42930 [Nonomuraea sp. KC401]|uniref:hypothetical protein n=1 Tax=unclassified Nonomuraea TaxID=2593643 RepID=UPI0010FE3A04|nr:MULTISPECIES: hypothetical protein [unclassified Nonomuraea]NBF00162.1 hypothetical protein [Nonomuraea sp. K271]TLF53261.1 hypothetical protein FE391_42930 [Nonomuraea sp. KC401]